MGLWFLRPKWSGAWDRLRFSTITKKRQRIIALDVLRGLFLVTLIVNHMPWNPSLYSFLTGQSELFASAAEGFFVVSGMLVGYIYGQKIIGSARETFKRIWKRALLLYILSVGATLTYTLIAVGLPGNLVGIEPWSGTIQSYLLNTFSLRYSYGWADFLNRYAIFMFAAPFALWLVSRGKAWLVTLLSIIVWIVLGSNVYVTPFAGWQLIFMIGLVLGYYLPQIELRVRTLPRRTKTIALRALITLAGLTYVGSVLWSVVLPLVISTYGTVLPSTTASLLTSIVSVREAVWEPWFSKSSLGVGRVLIGTLWFICLYVLVRTYEQQLLSRRLGQIVEFLGRHSLFVYVTHGVLIVLVNLLIPPPSGYINLLVNTIIVSAILWSVYAITRRRDYFDRLVDRTRKRVNREDF